ncbi:EamA family transporter RarD [Pseudodesulfovibrio senegalensis]|jgi:chloramphenicol-sensitive protein RarD|uniref:EamA family transporter RarD n=1 Tax=Pseudodesulfovibrio senegalensis TaxID=1721087 RepID=A0A6N6N701_9BACT|nr:EamA family transporter RarD [Pseudodesulfovibrio senegalensis]KAB1443235.1 EamA family transporter RarD [Pseudodesulfovibrio senegalensis]
MTNKKDNRTASGLTAALGAFIGWGLLPIYWKQLHHVPAMEILCHRIIWSLVFACLLVTIQGRWRETIAPLSSKRTLGMLTMSSLLLGSNWLMYIWCVNHDQVLATSLGYYINPLMNALLGFALLREKMSRLQLFAICFAAAGVINSIVSLGHFPWLALALAVTFALYGLLRKTAPMESLPGLTVETAIITPLALSYVLYLEYTGQGTFGHAAISTNLFLMGAGVATSMPLFGFAFGARRLRLTTLGIIQYIAPSIAFLLGVFVYREPFTTANLTTFALIWTGLAIYSADSIMQVRRARRQNLVN